MANTTCGHCGRLAHMSAISDLFLIHDPERGGSTQEAVYRCPNCKHLILASEYQWGSNADGVYGDPRAADDVRWTNATWLPRRGEVVAFEDVPEHIAQAASEATLCLSLGAYRAVGSLARAVVEATAKEKGAEGRDLAKRIEALREADHVRRHTAEQAHEIRHFGNGMAHGDFVDPVTKEEAEEVVALMAEVLDEVYQSPARLQRRRDARRAKEESGA